MSNGEAFLELDQVNHLTGNGAHIVDPWQGMLVKRDLNNVLEKIVVSLKDELGFAFDEHFGTDEEDWNEFNVLTTMQMIVAQASGRFTYGLPLCKAITPTDWRGTSLIFTRQEQGLDPYQT